MVAQRGTMIPANVKLSPAERQRIEGLLGTDITLLGRHWEIVNQCLNYKDGGQQYIEAADFLLEFTNFVKAGIFVSRVARVLSVADLILGPLGNLIALMKASVSGRETFAYAGIAYGMTAWAFGQPKPPVSQIRMKYLRESKPQEVGLWTQAWNKGVDTITRELESLSRSDARAKKTLQKVLRGMGENNPKTLNYVVMLSMEDKVKEIGGEAGMQNWRYFNDKYTYPA
jgi:hypothetical protein